MKSFFELASLIWLTPVMMLETISKYLRAIREEKLTPPGTLTESHLQNIQMELSNLLIQIYLRTERGSPWTDCIDSIKDDTFSTILLVGETTQLLSILKKYYGDTESRDTTDGFFGSLGIRKKTGTTPISSTIVTTQTEGVDVKYSIASLLSGRQVNQSIWPSNAPESGGPILQTISTNRPDKIFSLFSTSRSLDRYEPTMDAHNQGFEICDLGASTERTSYENPEVAGPSGTKTSDLGLLRTIPDIAHIKYS